MFVFGSKKTPVLAPVALLLLYFSIRPIPAYPHAQDEEDTMELEESLDNEENLESARYEDEDLDEEHDLEADTDASKKTCAKAGEKCDSENGCCNSKKECGAREGSMYCLNRRL